MSFRIRSGKRGLELRLHALEAEIMDIVWDQGEASAFEVREILGQRREISRTAVRTTLERLEEKGWLTHRVVGRTHFYRPLVSREVSLGQRIVDLVDKACGGEPAAEHITHGSGGRPAVPR